MATVPQTIIMSYVDALIEETLERHRQILLARAYHNGVQPIYLTDRQKEYLELHQDNQFCLNVCRLVVTALRDELTVSGFDTSEEPDADGVKKQAEWLRRVWDRNKMDSRQSETHEWALRDSEVFIILDWDKEEKYPVMVLHERFTSIEAQAWEGRWAGLSDWTMENLTGTGQGVWAIYENDDPNQAMTAAIQQWNEIDYDESGKPTVTRRRTIYYPDRIERYMYDDAEWVQMENSPQPWKNGNEPIGIPVIHFKNQNMMPENWDAIPPQDAVNKTWVDILGMEDLMGFPMLKVLGLYPTTDGKPPAEDNSNVWAFGPAQMIGNAGAKANEASIDKIDGADPTPLMEALKDQIMFIAQITGTPASRFITTAAIASSDTLKEQDRTLRKRAYNRQVLFGDAWSEVMKMARRINNAFNSEKMDETVDIKTVWKSIEGIDDLMQEKEIGIPEEVLWQKLGYSAEQIHAMKQTAEYKLRFEKLFWEAYGVASQSGQTVENFARRMGLSEEEIQLLGGSDSVPPTDV